MQCFHPIRIRDPNGGPDDRITVPCGHCFACQGKRRKEWHMRIKYEMLHSVCSYTVTLTYDQDHIPAQIPFYDKDPLEFMSGDNTEVAFRMEDSPWKDENILFWYHPYNLDHVQRFFKRLRKDGFQFRYFGVAEYGGKRCRPHYHIIFFFEEFLSLVRFQTEVVKQWPYGVEIVVDETDDRCIGYTLKYCLKFYNVKQPGPKIFLSKKPFIGAGYMKDSTVSFLRGNCVDVVQTVIGQMRLPRLLREKLFNDDELELVSLRLQNNVIPKIQDEEKRQASKVGIDVSEFRNRLRKAYTEKCIRAIKKQKL